MEELYPQVLFSTPGMLSVFVIVIVMEILSLGYLGITIVEFMMLRRRHASFFQSIGSDGNGAHVERAPTVILWIYIAVSLIVTIVTIVLFLFQPHLI